MAVNFSQWTYNKDDEVLIGLSFCINCKDTPVPIKDNSIFCGQCHGAFVTVPDRALVVSLLQTLFYNTEKALDFQELEDKVIIYTQEFKITISLINYGVLITFLTDFVVRYETA